MNYQCALKKYVHGEIKDAENICKNLVSNFPTCHKSIHLLGIIAFERKDYWLAKKLFLQAISLKDDEPDYYHNLANAYHHLKDYKAAESSYTKVFSLNSTHPNLCYNLANTLLMQGRFEQARDLFYRALLVNPDNSAIHLNLGVTYRELGELHLAMKSFEYALALDPSRKEAHWNLSRIYFLLDNLQRGWQEFSYRFQGNIIPSINSDTGKPYWNFEPLNDKSLLIWGEQGVGDVVMFSTILYRLKEYAKNITLAIDPRLINIMKYSLKQQDLNFNFLDQNHITGEYDYQLPIGNLGILYLDNFNEFPNCDKLLMIPNELRQDIRHHLNPENKILVGISWNGGNALEELLRSVDLNSIMEVLHPYKDKVRLVNLQHGKKRTELIHANFDIADHEYCPVANLPHHLEVIQTLDLVITIDNSNLHFAAASGIPTIGILPEICDWRYFGENTKSPWYKNLTLIRKQSDSNISVFTKLNSTLRTILC